MNNHLLLGMRIKDDVKQEAIIDATVKLVNEIGFVACSVAKIAKQANVSPATLYIYYKNKEDLLVSTYIEIKKDLFAAIIRDLDESMPMRSVLFEFWKNGFDYFRHNAERFRYAEQFANTPFMDLINPEVLHVQFRPLQELIEKGIEQKVLKKIPFELVTAFLFFPINTLVNPRYCSSFSLTEENIELAFSLAWDAIKY